MKKLFTVNSEKRWNDIWLLIFRLCIGTFMLSHGIPKFLKLIGSDEIQFADPFGFGPVASLTLTVFAEVLCSILIMLGLATRLASIPLILTMLVAVFYAHDGDPFKDKEMGLLYLIIYINMLVTGGGKYSIDYILTTKK